MQWSMTLNKDYRLRIAPSPTGYPHIGTIYQALFNFAFAKKHNGSFVVRIEDTDQKRFVEGAEQIIYSMLDWTNLIEDESPRKGGPYGPYLQSDRLKIYQEYAEKLIENKSAYYCFCSKERLAELRTQQLEKKQLPRYDKHCLNVKDAQQRVKNGEPYVIRLNVLPNRKIWFNDLIRGKIEFDSNLIDDQVLLKSDGFPTYHLAVVVDDHLMNITYIVRGEEWISSTPKHILLYQAFGWDLPIFCHTPDLRNPDKSKLSKRHGHTDVRWYQKEGYLAEAMLNYLALLGWSHPGEKEIFSLREFINVFDLKDIRAVGPIFDVKKFTWLNGEHIRQLSDQELKLKLLDFFKSDTEVLTVLNSKQGDMFISLAKARMKTLIEFKYLVEDAKMPKLTLEQKEQVKKVLEHIKGSNIDWENGSLLLDNLKQLKAQDVSMKQLYYYITYKEQGLPLIELMQSWGKEKTIKRLLDLIN